MLLLAAIILWVAIGVAVELLWLMEWGLFKCAASSTGRISASGQKRSPTRGCAISLSANAANRTVPEISIGQPVPCIAS